MPVPGSQTSIISLLEIKKSVAKSMPRHRLSHFSTFSESKTLSFSNIHKETEQNKLNSLKKTGFLQNRARLVARKERARDVARGPGDLGFATTGAERRPRTFEDPDPLREHEKKDIHPDVLLRVHQSARRDSNPVFRIP